MEDNNAINQQHDVVNLEEKCQQLEAENGKLKQIADNLYGRVRQLENTWMLQRAGFLFEVLKLDAFNGDTKIKAEEELTKFLFPEPVQENDNN